jgi:hypothetical protein
MAIVEKIPVRSRICLLMMLMGLITGIPCLGIAGTLSTTGTIGVDVAITMTKNADINFGTVKAVTASTYTITTAGVVSASGSGAALYGTPAAGSITIAGSTTSTVNISVGSYTASNGVTPSAATCAYNGGASGSCTITGAAAPGAGKTLLLGVAAAVSGSQAAGSSAAPTFVVTAVYP